jgi:hypothetical protein
VASTFGGLEGAPELINEGKQADACVGPEEAQVVEALEVHRVGLDSCPIRIDRVCDLTGALFRCFDVAVCSSARKDTTVSCRIADRYLSVLIREIHRSEPWTIARPVNRTTR